MRFSSSLLCLYVAAVPSLLGLPALAQTTTTTATSTSSVSLATATTDSTTMSASSTASYSDVTTITTTSTSAATTASATSTAVATGTATAPTYTLDPTFEITTATSTRSYSWTIAAQTGSPDGYEKTVYTVNGQMPGPLIEANEGDTLEITITNTLSEGTSVHWHGMYQNGTAYEDGVPGFSQCPIPAGSSYTYTFSTAGQYGTYWWHSHSSTQYTDGILGPMIIHSTSDPYVRGVDFTSEQVIFVQDWYHDQSEAIATALLTHDGYNGSTAAPSPQSGLINGVGVYNCSLATSGTCTDLSAPAITVAAEKIRFRVINGGSHSQEYISIDLHYLNVTGADGTPVLGPLVERVPIHNGQRYDFIADFSNATDGDSFWLRGEINTNCFASVDSTLDATSRLAIYVATDDGTEPSTTDWTVELPTSCVDFDDSDLVPVEVVEAPLGLTVDNVREYNSAFGQLSVSDVTYSRFFVNSTTYTNYIYEPFLATVNNGSTISDSDVAWSEAADDEWAIDIIINNGDSGLDHPYHLHGADFYIVARGTGTLTKDSWADITFNTTNPPRRDTLVIPGGDYAVLRISSDIPGVWPLHCHIAWHLAQGFMGALVVHPEAIVAADLFPTASQELCNAGLAQGYSEDTTEPGRRRRAVQSSPRMLSPAETRDIPPRFLRPNKRQALLVGSV